MIARPLHVLLFVLLLACLPVAAMAYCCTNYAVSGNCCNIFGCNCDGPCTNFGCAGEPVIGGEICGVVQKYDVCTPDGSSCHYCDPGSHPCNNCQGCCADGSAAAATQASEAKRKELTLFAVGSAMQRFKEIDTNGDGKITFEEARDWVRKHSGGERISDRELRAAFDALDKNKNGTIEPGELDASLAKH